MAFDCLRAVQAKLGSSYHGYAKIPTDYQKAHINLLSAHDECAGLRSQFCKEFGHELAIAFDLVRKWLRDANIQSLEPDLIELNSIFDHLKEFCDQMKREEDIMVQQLNFYLRVVRSPHRSCRF